MKLSEILEQRLIIELSATTKRDALNALVDHCHSVYNFDKLESLREEVFYREKLLSTGLGLGLAIPHVRSDNIHKPLITIGISKQGITDYASLDNVTIQIIFLILVGKHQQREYLMLLSQIVNKVKATTPISDWLNQCDTQSIYSQLIS